MNRRFLGAPAVAGALVFGVILCCAVGLHAQAVAIAEIDGVITDASGKMVPGAKVTATEVDKHLIRETTADGEGRFFLPDLPIGPYQLEVKSPGFKDYRQTGITLRTAQNTTINVQLTIGAVTETVEVTANASMVETKDSAIGQVMEYARDRGSAAQWPEPRPVDHAGRRSHLESRRRFDRQQEYSRIERFADVRGGRRHGERH